ncbi:ABC transporter transmembrane region family protein (macronuclear) [Tetrahymena thermophila SB210]|uniref:ABC transporter transmembrane region family protein n=1 Tax=Tetrahymena thermophila (strain SB210) TaxID=312017 RepID=Q22M76_TETTS|nr:ABC transporter transmembrane region family protein [Tetrahymena thermophila SB210]EAR86427.2 ABC transporter transmembrane region family protein [Tetrahymena thermophila SB210]|eukprot:XP_977144.2 ABC transporter transmembrane region family protein [Tetrahymena thermophila SB210]
MQYLEKLKSFANCSLQNEVSKKDEIQKSKKKEIPSQFQIWRFYLKFMKIDWRGFFIVNLNFIICSLILAYEPFLMIELKQSLQEQNYSQVKYLLFCYIVCQIIEQILHYQELQYYFNTNDIARQRIQKSILEHLFSLDIQFFEDNKVTYLSNIVQEGAEQITSEISYGKFTKIFNQYTEIISQLIFVYCQSPQIFLFVSVIAIIGAIINYFINIKKQKSEKNTDFQNEYKVFALDDIITNIHLIKIFNKEQNEIENLTKIINDNSKNQNQIEYLKQLKYLIRNFCFHAMKLGIILLLVISGLEDSQNKSIIINSLAEILVYVYSAILLSKDISKVIISKPAKYYHKKYKYIGKVMRLFEIKPKIKDNNISSEKNQPIQYLKGSIKFENVNFKYPITTDSLFKQKQIDKQDSEVDYDSSESESSLQDCNQELDSHSSLDGFDSQNSLDQTQLKDKYKLQRKYVLQNINFEIKPGQLVAFVGMSGSGKSTLVKLIERYYDVEEGVIMLDDKNIKDIPLNYLRGSIGLVNQEPSLFDNDIEYNITYGCQDGKYTQEELRQICDVSGVSEFVFDEQRFPEGLKTLVGSKGIKLSGGQKQRIAIARALMKKPSILILDEATSSLDAQSEHLVQKYIDQLMGYRGITIIVIAHRLSTIVKSDVIYVMENGEIKEYGNHSQLIAQNGVYKRLVYHQIQIHNS